MLTIAKNTFIETIRDRILYSVLFFAVLLFLASLAASDISLHQNNKILIDLGLSLISLFGIIITLFIGSKLIFSEIYSRTILIILTKPVRRYQFLFGKWLGLASVITLITFLFTLLFFGILYFHNITFELLFLEAIIFSLFEQFILISFAIFFSTFTSSPIICMFCVLAMFIAGHITEDLIIYAIHNGTETFKSIANVIYYLVPNLEYFNLKTQVAYNIGLSFEQAVFTVLYGSFLVIFILYLSTVIFRTKEF